MHTNEIDYLTVYYYIARAFSVFNMIYNIDAIYYVIVYTSCSMCKNSGGFSLASAQIYSLPQLHKLSIYS